jgi:WD40 repeat protein
MSESSCHFARSPYSEEMLATILLAAAGLFAADPPSPVTALVFAPEGKSLVAAGQVGVTSYSWPELKQRQRTKPPFSHLHDLAFSPSGTRLAIAGGEPQESGSVEIAEWPGLKTLQRIDVAKDVICQVAWSSDGKTLATASADKTVRLHDLTGQKTTEISDHSAAVLAVLFVSAPTEESKLELLLSAGRDQSIRVFDAATARPIRTLDNHTAAVTDLALCPAKGGRLPIVASAAQDKTVRFWQPSIGRLVRFAKVPSPPLCVRWLPEGDHVAVACTDGHLRVLDWRSLETVLDKKVTDGWLTSLAISPDGAQAVVGDERGELQSVPLDGIKRQ